MKLLEVNKLFKISIESDELSKYLKALDNLITANEERTDDINTLKRFSIELTKILQNARDY